MGAIWEWLQGKKMYLTALIVAVFAGLQYLGISIPEWAYTLLGALGIVATKSALAKTGP